MTTGTVTFVPKEDDDKKILKCQAHNPAIANSTISDRTQLNVHCKYSFIGLLDRVM